MFKQEISHRERQLKIYMQYQFHEHLHFWSSEFLLQMLFLLDQKEAPTTTKRGKKKERLNYYTVCLGNRFSRLNP